MNSNGMVIRRNLNGHPNELDGLRFNEMDGLTIKGKTGVKGPCCRGMESQTVAFRNLSSWQFAGPSPIKQDHLHTAAGGSAAEKL